LGVIPNLALWFAIHTLFGRVEHVRIGGAGFDLPVLATLNLPALVLAATAAIAVFRFKIGMIPVLLACSALGILYYLVTGQVR